MPNVFGRSEKWNDCLNRFLASVANETTRYQYTKTLTRFFAFIARKYGEVRTPDKVTQADIEEFLQQPSQNGHREGSPLSPWSQNSYLMAIRSFYGYAATFEQKWRGRMVPILRKKPPTEHVKLAKTGEVERDMTEEEVVAFFAQIDRTTLLGKRDYALFWALLITGRRRMEITNLLRGDLEYGLFQTDEGQTRKGWRFHFRAKWRVARESAEMDVSVVDALREFHRAAGRDWNQMAPDEPLFPGISGCSNHHKPMRLSNADKRFSLYARAANLPPNIVLHSLRWENAYQRYLANGNDLIKTAKEMRWSSIDQAAHYIERRKQKLTGDRTASAIAAKFAAK